MRGRFGAAAIMAVLAASALVFGQITGDEDRVPELRIEAPGSLSRHATRLRSMDVGRLGAVARLTGLTDAGLPIRILLVPERVEISEATPPWIAGFADPSQDLVVMFPSRTGPYPHTSLEALLDHEVAHILIARAAGGRPLPRWFDEGLASAAERTWVLSDRSRFAWEIATGGRVSLADLDRLFTRGRSEAARAYVISHAFVRELLATYGLDLPSRLLSSVADGASFEAAFAAATGDTAAAAADRLWRDYELWGRWVPLLTEPFTLWMLMTLLALVAIWSHRRRRAARRRQWDEEERLEEQRVTRPRAGYDVH